MAEPIPPQVPGGSSAMPIYEDDLRNYAKLASEAPGHVREAMNVLIKAIRRYHGSHKVDSAQVHPDVLDVNFHKRRKGMKRVLSAPIALPSEVMKKIDDDLPWWDELQAFNARFEELSADTQTELRNAAFHLSWYVTELYLGREPNTLDRVKITKA